MIKRARVLVVDDEVVVAQDIREMLSGLGYDVVGTATSATEAIAQARERTPDVVLMDIRLKGDPDGIEAATEIRKHSDIPVVFLTAYADDMTLERAKSAAPYAYLVKPIGERELNTTLQIALHRYRLDQGREDVIGLSRVLEDLGGGQYALDSEWCFTEISPAAEVLLGTKRESLLGRSIWEEYPELQVSALHDLFEQVAASGSEASLEAYHFPAGLRVRLHIRPSDGGITVYFFATETIRRGAE